MMRITQDVPALLGGELHLLASIPAIDRLDLFEIYRWMVAIVGTSYSVVVMAHTITQYASNLSQLGPRGAMIRRYLFVHALRLKFRRFRWDLIQIAFLAILLGYLVGLHKSLRVFEL